MNSLIINKSKLRRAISSDSTLFLIVGSSLILASIYFVPKIGTLIEKAYISKGGLFESFVILAGLAIGTFWVILLLRERYLAAFGVQILFLPFGVRASQFFGFAAFTSDTFVQRLSLTTFMIVGLYSYLLMRKSIVGSMKKRAETFEKYLLLFSILITISQFLNYPAIKALLISIGGIWQYVALYYIISSIVKTKQDIHYILKLLVFTIILGIVSRVGFEGSFRSFFLVKGQSVLYERVGTWAFGPPVYYGGYVTFVIILSLYLCQSAIKKGKKLFWLSFTALLVFEMLNTFTRGAVLALAFIVLLYLWRNQRKFFYKLAFLFLIVVIISGPKLFELVTMRYTTGVPILQQPGVESRLSIYKQSLSPESIFINYGLGQGIGRQMHFYMRNIKIVSHALILEMIQTIGLYATIAFILLYFYVCFNLLKITRRKHSEFSSLSTYLFIALLSWFFYANTTYLSILFYVPYEATILFYTVLFLSVRVITLDKLSKKKQVTEIKKIGKIVSIRNS